jgi:excisionase family DNA binding protein
MTVIIDGEKYYRASEACTTIGISRTTLYRWLKAGILPRLYRDRRGWLLFSQEDLNKIKAEAQKINVEYIAKTQPE